MIKEKEKKADNIIKTIRERIGTINQLYRSGPDLYFYKRILFLRNNSQDISSFLKNDYHLEIAYATLVSWDMNSRGAKMKYFDDFKSNILSCLKHFVELDKIKQIRNNDDELNLTTLLWAIYRKLNLMKTGGCLVSNSKLLHFLFPSLLMPMDRQNTLQFFYGNTGESETKYFEILELSNEIMRSPLDWNSYLDIGWNSTIPKIIDNAIILLVGKSITTPVVK